MTVKAKKINKIIWLIITISVVFLLFGTERDFLQAEEKENEVLVLHEVNEYGVITSIGVHKLTWSDKSTITFKINIKLNDGKKQLQTFTCPFDASIEFDSENIPPKLIAECIRHYYKETYNVEVTVKFKGLDKIFTRPLTSEEAEKLINEIKERIQALLDEYDELTQDDRPQQPIIPKESQFPAPTSKRVKIIGIRPHPIDEE